MFRLGETFLFIILIMRKIFDLLLIVIFTISIFIAIQTQENKSIVFEIAIGIVVSYIFYVFIEIIPRMLRIHRSKKILAFQVHWLLYELFVLINQILFAFDIEMPINKVQEKDLLHIDGDMTKVFDGVYETSEHYNQFWKKGKQISGFSDMRFKFPDEIVSNLAKLTESIDNIRKSNPNFYVDDKFAEILSSIETNKLIEWYVNKKHKIFQFGGTCMQLYSLVNDYNRLTKLNYHKLYHDSYQRIHFYTQQEILNIPKEMNQFYAEVAAKINRTISLIPCIIYNPKYSDSRALITELDQKIVSSKGMQKRFFLYVYDNEISPPLSSKCVVIIGAQIPKKQIKEYIKNNKDNKVIILLKSNGLFTSNKFKDKTTRIGLHIIHYRKPLRLFGILFFRKHPTRNEIGYARFNVFQIMGNFSQEA